MFNKKIIGQILVGVVLFTIVIAVTANVFLTKENSDPKYMDCDELQHKIDEFGRPGFDMLPRSIREVMLKGNNECTLTGRDWLMIAGKLDRQMERPVIGDEKSMIDDLQGKTNE